MRGGGRGGDGVTGIVRGEREGRVVGRGMVKGERGRRVVQSVCWPAGAGEGWGTASSLYVYPYLLSPSSPFPSSFPPLPPPSLPHPFSGHSSVGGERGVGWLLRLHGVCGVRPRRLLWGPRDQQRVDHVQQHAHRIHGGLGGGHTYLARLTVPFLCRLGLCIYTPPFYSTPPGCMQAGAMHPPPLIPLPAGGGRAQ